MNYDKLRYGFLVKLDMFKFNLKWLPIRTWLFLQGKKLCIECWGAKTISCWCDERDCDYCQGKGWNYRR